MFRVKKAEGGWAGGGGRGGGEGEREERGLEENETQAG